MNGTPLNILQKLMRRWDAVHPYNAAQVMKLTGSADAQAWNRAWESTVVQTGLGAVCVDRDRYDFVPLNGRLASYGVRLSTLDLSEHISMELNRAFDDPGEPPFRPFLIQTDGFFYAGLVYQHWLADSASIRMLMHEWFARVFDPAAASAKAMDRSTCGYWGTMASQHRGLAVARSVVDMTRRHVRLRRVQKIDSTALDDRATRFELFDTAPGLIDHVRDTARSRQVKVNDIFLAALIQTCAGTFRCNPVKNERISRWVRWWIFAPGAAKTLPTLSGCFWGLPM